MIKFDNVSFLYNAGSSDEMKALDGVSFEIGSHEFVGLLGHTGSGKSTLVQHMNGLNIPSQGKVYVNDRATDDKDGDLRKIRQEVGLVFQYPEDQLFEDTIYKDIAFGPKNLKLDPEEIDTRVRSAMKSVGLDFEELKDRSPFELSGGQKRRVAIAGVLALNPSYLVLDEPTAGLDPRGREEILGEIGRLYKERENLSVILVTHSMEDVAKHANRLLVMDKGRLIMDGRPKEIFSREEELEAIGLSLPAVTRLMRRLKKGGWDIDERSLTVDEAVKSISAYLDTREGATNE